MIRGLADSDDEAPLQKACVAYCDPARDFIEPQANAQRNRGWLDQGPRQKRGLPDKVRAALAPGSAPAKPAAA